MTSEISINLEILFLPAYTHSTDHIINGLNCNPNFEMEVVKIK